MNETTGPFDARDRWHTQTLAGGYDVPLDKRGDCVRACITSILGLPLDAVANVHGEGWWDRLRAEVNVHGYDLAIFSPQYEPPMEAYWIATVPSLNLPPDPDGRATNHVVVARGYTLIHDPSMGRKYDQEAFAATFESGAMEEGWLLVPVDPAQMRAAA